MVSIADINLSIHIGIIDSVLVAIGVLIDIALLAKMDKCLTWSGVTGCPCSESWREKLDSSVLLSVFKSSLIRFSGSAEESLLRLLLFLWDHFLFGDSGIAQELEWAVGDTTACIITHQFLLAQIIQSQITKYKNNPCLHYMWCSKRVW